MATDKQDVWLTYSQVRTRPLTRLAIQALVQIGAPATADEIFGIIQTFPLERSYGLDSVKNDINDFSDSDNNRQDPDPARRPPIIFERLKEKGPRGANLWWFAPLTMPADQPDPDIIVEATKMVLVRIVQARFRRDVLVRWGQRCCITGVDMPHLLIASHIKPWRVASSGEKTDVNNGIILSPNYDKLFDLGLITFVMTSENGTARLILNPAVAASVAALGIDRHAELTGLHEASRPYLAFHNQLFRDRLEQSL